jgi:hypothetical protein
MTETNHTAESGGVDSTDAPPFSSAGPFVDDAPSAAHPNTDDAASTADPATEGVIEDWSEQSDEDFVAWLASEFRGCVAYRTDPASAAVLEAAAVAVGRWRRRFREGGSREVWQRVMRNHRLVKELNEAAPVVARVLAVASRLKLPPNGKATVLDLCSGFGYVSMLLSDLLPPDKVRPSPSSPPLSSQPHPPYRCIYACAPSLLLLSCTQSFRRGV